MQINNNNHHHHPPVVHGHTASTTVSHSWQTGGKQERSKVRDHRQHPPHRVNAGKNTLDRQHRVGKRPPRQRTSLHVAKASAGKASATFPCLFVLYGCSSDFGNKNEWKRHIQTQHMLLEHWHCEQCKESREFRRPNNFNRRDLFVQHILRMHPFSPPLSGIPGKDKKAAGRCSPKSEAEQQYIEKEATRCYRRLRRPPETSRCIMCERSFSGSGSWEQRLDHIGRHLEDCAKGVALTKPQEWHIDHDIEQYLLREKIVVLRGRRLILTGEGISDLPERNMATQLAAGQLLTSMDSPDENEDHGSPQGPALTLARAAQSPSSMHSIASFPESPRISKKDGDLDTDVGTLPIIVGDTDLSPIGSDIRPVSHTTMLADSQRVAATLRKAPVPSDKVCFPCSVPLAGPPGLTIRDTELAYDGIEEEDLSDVENDLPGLEIWAREWQQRSRIRAFEREFEEATKRRQRRLKFKAGSYDHFSYRAESGRTLTEFAEP